MYALGPFGPPVAPCHAPRLLLEWEGTGGPEPVLLCGRSLWYPSAYSLASGSWGHCRTGKRRSASRLRVANPPSPTTVAQASLIDLSRWGSSCRFHTGPWEPLSVSRVEISLSLLGPVLPPSCNSEPFAPSQGPVAGNVRWKGFLSSVLRHARALRSQTNPSLL